MGEIARIWIDPSSCLHHGCCRSACPEVFALPEPGRPGSPAVVKPGADAFFESHDLNIRMAVAACPMDAIRIEER